MHRRGPSRSTNGASPATAVADSNGGGHRYKTRRSAGRRDPSCVPRSCIGLLIVGSGLLFLVAISQFFATTTTTTSSDGGDAARGLRVKKAGNGNENAPSLPLDPIGLASPATNATLHVIFSTDCGSYQHWQSYLFFYSALKVKQPGYVTRIASGCTDEQLEHERDWHETHIRSKMSDRFRVHFTPHFSGVKDEATGEVKGDYKFFNKPFGLKHFLEENDLLGLAEGGMMKHPDDVIILTDPDFLLLRPITDDYSDTRETLLGRRRKSIYENKKSHIVTHGNPYAQTYGLGAQWRKFDLDAIAGPTSPAKDVEQREGGLYYPAGPPYVATAKDMYQIAVTWSEFAPRVHKQYPHLLAEMYAYCIAAAHLRLPHMLVDSLMVSASGIGGEGWKFVEDVPADEVCAFAGDPDHAARPVPSVVHYCQRYHVDRYFWGKRKVPHGVFTCEHPPLVEPPADLGSGRYLGKLPVGRPNGKREEMSAEKEKMEAFMVCALTRRTNDAMAFFKKNGCNGDEVKKGRAYDMWAMKEVDVAAT